MGGACVFGLEFGHTGCRDQVGAGAGVDRVSELSGTYSLGDAALAHAVPLGQLGDGVGLLLAARRQPRRDLLDQRIGQGVEDGVQVSHACASFACSSFPARATIEREGGENMFMDAFFDAHGLPMKIERGGIIIGDAIGLPNHEQATGKAYIGFRPKTDIATNDVVINPAGDRYHIIGTEASYFKKELQQIKAFYMDESEYLSRQQQSGTTYNIGVAYGSVIGTGNTATINYQSNIAELRQRVEKEEAPDREQMNKLLDLLQMVIDDQVPVQKGLFARFSSVMEKHSWISSAVASTLLTWLTQFPH